MPDLGEAYPKEFLNITFFSSLNWVLLLQVFMVRKIVGPDSGTIYAMKVLKKATLKGIVYFMMISFLIEVYQKRVISMACTFLSY